jgi:hypothetical protein
MRPVESSEAPTLKVFEMKTDIMARVVGASGQ